jgi:hypothetical protein
MSTSLTNESANHTEGGLKTPEIPVNVLLSLEAYISNLFYLIFIQDDDEIFQHTFKKHWSPDVMVT